MRYIFIVLIFLFQLSNAQQSTGIIYPGNSFTNTGKDTLFYLSKITAEKIIDREEINAKLISTLEKRIVVCDTALAQKTAEAQSWYNKLLENDKLLQNAEEKNVRQKHRHQVLSKVWFGSGIVLGYLLCILIA